MPTRLQISLSDRLYSQEENEKLSPFIYLLSVTLKVQQQHPLQVLIFVRDAIKLKFWEWPSLINRAHCLLNVLGINTLT